MVRLFAIVFGIAYLGGGIAGFFLPNPVLGTFEVNTAHDVMHIGIGSLWLVAAIFQPFGPASARTVSAAIALYFLILAVIGFIAPEQLDNMLRINLNDNLLHLATGAFAGWIGFMTDPGPASSKAARA